MLMMQYRKNNVLERVTGFFTAITPSDKVCIIHDTDPDGVCSAVIVAKTIQRMGNQVSLVLPTDKEEYGITKNMLAKMKKKGITKLITCDFSPEQEILTLKKAEETCDILIIDHHKIYANVKSEKIILYKPQFLGFSEPQKYCTAKLAYDALSKLTDISDLDWMALSASIADISTEPWKDWVRTVFKKYKQKQNKDLFKSIFGEIAKIVSSVDVYNSSFSKLSFSTFMSASHYNDVLRSELSKYTKIIDREIQRHKRFFSMRKQKYNDLLIYELKSKYRIQSVLSTLLGLEYPKKTIVIINKTNVMTAVSARRGDSKRAVNTLLEKATWKFPDSNAGGHITSAGAGFPRKYLNTFKKRIIAEYS